MISDMELTIKTIIEIANLFDAILWPLKNGGSGIPLNAAVKTQLINQISQPTNIISIKVSISQYFLLCFAGRVVL